MLKIEDLKEGDELEFISDKDREEYVQLNPWSQLVADLFKPNNCVESVFFSSGEVLFKGEIGKWYNVVTIGELKYFRKVETNKEVLDTPEVEPTYVNAGIKSTKEMYTRLLEGEVFYFEDERYVFEDGYFYTRYKEGGVDPYINLLEKYEHFQVKKPWYEFASEGNPILCKVWDNDSEGEKYQVQFDLISGFDIDEQECYIGEDGCSWMNATPVKPSE